jgi:hypothetical protein
MVVSTWRDSGVPGLDRYLENEDTIKEYLAQSDRELERSVLPLSRTDPNLFARLQAGRRPATPKRA